MRTPKSAKGFDEFVEAFFDFMTKTAPIGELVEKDAFAIVLKLAAPATAKRLIASALLQCAQRGEALPLRLAELVSSYLVSETTRNRVRRRGELAKGAFYQAMVPDASLRDIAQFAGVDHTVARDWRRQLAYKREVTKWLSAMAKATYRRYVEQFSSPFSEAGLPEPESLDLVRLRPVIEQALSLGTPVDLVAERARLKPVVRKNIKC